MIFKLIEQTSQVRDSEVAIRAAVLVVLIMAISALLCACEAEVSGKDVSLKTAKVDIGSGVVIEVNNG